MLLEHGLTRRWKWFSVENIGDPEKNPTRSIPSVDILQRWEDGGGTHAIGHEVKAEITWAMNQSGYGRYIKPHQKELQPWTGCSDNGLCKGTGNLFIETRSLPSGKPGWYPMLKDALSDGLTRFLWFVLVSDSPVIQEVENGNVTFLDPARTPRLEEQCSIECSSAQFR